MTEIDPLVITNWKAFDAAMKFGHNSMADVLCDARLAAAFLLGHETPVETVAEGPSTAEKIPFTGEGVTIAVFEDAIVTGIHTHTNGTATHTALNSEPLDEMPVRTPKAKKVKKPKAKRTRAARVEVGAVSQDFGSTTPETGSHVPGEGDHLPNGASELPQAA